MLALKYRTLSFCAGFILLLVLALGSTTTTFADSPTSTTTTVTTSVSAGALSVDVGSPSAPTSITFNSSEQERRYLLPVTVTDATGSGNGWTLTAQNSDDPTPQAANAMFLRGVTAACAVGSTCTNPVSTISYTSPITIPAGTMTAAPVQVFNAARDTGMGTFTITLMISIFVPPNTPVNASSNALTFTLSSGVEV